MELSRYPRHCVTDGVVFLNISTPSTGEIAVDVLWVDKYCPAEIDMPGIGIVAIPGHIANQKNSLVVLEQRLTLQPSQRI